jgi:hypothetical protein
LPAAPLCSGHFVAVAATLLRMKRCLQDEGKSEAARDWGIDRSAIVEEQAGYRLEAGSVAVQHC